MNTIRTLKPAELADYTIPVSDSRLVTMLFRYRGRNFPETLSKEDQVLWKAFCRERLSDRQKNGFLDFTTFSESISKLKQQEGVDIQLLNALEQYAVELKARITED